MSQISLCCICEETVPIMGPEFRSMRSRGGENRFEGHHNIQVNTGAADYYLRDSMCRVERRRTRMYLRAIVFVRERSKLRQGI